MIPFISVTIFAVCHLIVHEEHIKGASIVAQWVKSLYEMLTSYIGVPIHVPAAWFPILLSTNAPGNAVDDGLSFSTPILYTGDQGAGLDFWFHPDLANAYI